MINKNFIFYILLGIVIKGRLINSKKIILNINRVSFQNFIGDIIIDDFINYDIYTELKVGTPPQKVTHFIIPNDRIFQFKKKDVNYNKNKFNDSVEKYLKNLFFLFDSDKSSSFEGYFSDNFILDTDDDTIEINLNFTIYYNNRNDENKFGIIGLQTMTEDTENNSFKELYSFIYQLKKLNIVTEYSFYFLYNNDNIFKSSSNIGKIIIGEYPHQFKENKIYKKEDEIKIYSVTNDVWSIKSDEIKLGDYIEYNMNLNFDFNSKFIKGSTNFNNKIKSIFFDELIKQDLCKNDIISENQFIFDYEIYYCKNNEIIREKIKIFPKLNFINKSNNLIFSLDYNDLFQLLENKDRLYFMIIFRTNKYVFLTDTWLIGEIFLKKYLFTFNLESKTISYYKNQINKSENNEINIIKKSNSFIRIFIELIMAIIIVLCIYLLYRKYKKSRKLLANELEDNNYAYVSDDQKK